MVEVGLEPTKTEVDSFTDCLRYQFAYSTKMGRAGIEPALSGLKVHCFNLLS